MVLYRKYRPQTLDDLIGQESVKKTLIAAHLGGKLSHAYLFVGPRGTGKTSTARILAKMVNCEKQNVSEASKVTKVTKVNTSETSDTSVTPETSNIPCNQCDICKTITDGSCLDLIEIDAASNRGIDDIRSLRENIKLAPSSCSKKVYIIDEVHMLTTEAFNALLKTLEEPPAHCLFILATTEVSKVPQTILSRVQRLDFKLAGVADVILALQKIAEEEKIKITPEALSLLAKKADGSFRDGVKLLDQLSTEAEITEEKIGALLGVSNFESIIEILRSISVKDAKASLSLVIKQFETEVSPKEFLLSLMDTLRDLMLIQNDLGNSLVKEEVGSDRYLQLEDLSKSFSLRDLVRSLDIFQEAFEKLKGSSIPTLPIELAVVEICSEESVSSIKYQVSRDETTTTVIANPETVKQSFLKNDKTLDKNPDKIALGSSNPRSDDIKTPEATDLPVSSEITTSPDVVKIQEKWTFVLETVKQENYSLEALLRNAKIADCMDGKVLIEVPYAFHQRILESPKSRDLIEAILTDILGRSAQISTVIGSRPQRREDLANVELAADDEVISMAAEIFQGKIVD